MRTYTTYPTQINEPRRIFDPVLDAAREVIQKEHYSDKQAKEAEFRICARLRFYDRAYQTTFDKEGECVMCSEPIIYDERVTAQKPKVCIPCALRLWRDGFKSIQALGTWEPSDQDVNDDLMMKKLEATIASNKAGDNDPKNVLPKAPLPEKMKRGKNEGEYFQRKPSTQEEERR